MTKRTPKTRSATTRQLTNELETVKGGWTATINLWPTRTQFNKDETPEEEDEGSSRG